MGASWSKEPLVVAMLALAAVATTSQALTTWAVASLIAKAKDDMIQIQVVENAKLKLQLSRTQAVAFGRGILELGVIEHFRRKEWPTSTMSRDLRAFVDENVVVHGEDNSCHLRPFPDALLRKLMPEQLDDFRRRVAETSRTLYSLLSEEVSHSAPSTAGIYLYAQANEPAMVAAMLVTAVLARLGNFSGGLQAVLIVDGVQRDLTAVMEAADDVIAQKCDELRAGTGAVFKDVHPTLRDGFFALLQESHEGIVLANNWEEVKAYPQLFAVRPQNTSTSGQHVVGNFEDLKLRRHMRDWEVDHLHAKVSSLLNSIDGGARQPENKFNCTFDDEVVTIDLDLDHDHMMASGTRTGLDHLLRCFEEHNSHFRVTRAAA